ncbi:MAG: hypothetical protein KDA89_01905 [Planctomycetaceae bacterium]|nr:hypothetical protein [Planctomycetaceae bacterium]
MSPAETNPGEIRLPFFGKILGCPSAPVWATLFSESESDHVFITVVSFTISTPESISANAARRLAGG